MIGLLDGLMGAECRCAVSARLDTTDRRMVVIESIDDDEIRVCLDVAARLALTLMKLVLHEFEDPDCPTMERAGRNTEGETK